MFLQTLGKCGLISNLSRFKKCFGYLETGSGISTTTIIIIVVVVVLLVAGGVTGYAYQKKILCFAPSTDGEEEEATGDESPLLKGTASASQVSPSRTNTASATTLNNSRPSQTTVSADWSHIVHSPITIVVSAFRVCLVEQWIDLEEICMLHACTYSRAATLVWFSVKYKRSIITQLQLKVKKMVKASPISL